MFFDAYTLLFLVFLVNHPVADILMHAAIESSWREKGELTQQEFRSNAGLNRDPLSLQDTLLIKLINRNFE